MKPFSPANLAFVGSGARASTSSPVQAAENNAKRMPFADADCARGFTRETHRGSWHHSRKLHRWRSPVLGIENPFGRTIRSSCPARKASGVGAYRFDLFLPGFDFFPQLRRYLP